MERQCAGGATGNALCGGDFFTLVGCANKKIGVRNNKHPIMSSNICFARLADGVTCGTDVQVSHPQQFQGYGQPRHAHMKFVPSFASERMTTNSEPGRFLIQAPLTSRPAKTPTAVRQSNSLQAPLPESDRMDGPMEE